jgi:hypothetical protein
MLPLLLFPFFVCPARAQPIMQTVEWCKTFGYGDACSVIQATDGNYLVAVQSSPTYRGVGHLGFYYDNLHGKILKISPSGKVVQTTDVPFLPKAMIQTGNGNLVIAGEIQTDIGTSETDVSTYSIYQSFASLAMIKAGVVVWNYTYYLPGQPLPDLTSTLSLGTNNGATVKFVLQTSDGGYLFGGSYTLTQQLFSDHITKPWLIRTDSLGNTVWIKTFEVETTTDNNGLKGGRGYATSAVETGDGCFLVIGNIGGRAIVKVDSTGAIVWSNDRIPSDNAQCYKVYSSIAITTDDGYLIAGNTHLCNDTYPSGVGVGYIAKLDANLSVQWSKNYEDYWLNQLSQKYYANSRYYFSAGYGSYILETDIYGNIKHVSLANGTINSLIPLNNGYLLVGAAESDPHSSIDTMNVWIEKLGDSTINPSPPETCIPFPSIPENPFTYSIMVIAMLAVTGVVYTKKRKSASAMNKTAPCRVN